ncbi:hypothetical protein NUW54_g10907 [Trametes sanguinea]|uniref:Uncharacterized protein n=1 Tax=Trametes sanguinea TaxID=158606 RepID=A0ACC1NQH4_9APHY|nr:hypothetical protein NUW54_g10907 [Trametes sanguinea]
MADGRPLDVVCGEALGGTSSINCILYTRAGQLHRFELETHTELRCHVGTPGDYNRWKELGNDGWGYDDLGPYFVKSETTHSHPPLEWRGPWQNQTHPHIPYQNMGSLVNALERAGIHLTADANSCTDTHVTRIEIVRESGRVHAKGAYFEATDYRRAGQRLYAKRAGRSCFVGIGPRDHLEEKGIPVQHDLPGVGNHLPIGARCLDPRDRPDLDMMSTRTLHGHEITGKGIFTLIVGLVRPKLKGRVLVANSNPRARPDVDLGLLTNEGLRAFAKGMEAVHEPG